MVKSKYFTLAEMTDSPYALRHGIDNTPTTADMRRLQDTMWQLDAVRELLNAPITISSGYRCAVLNTAIRGGKKSAHTMGYAADFTARAFGSPKAITKRLARSKIRFDQLIFEGTWVHISFDPRYRQEVLTANFTPVGVTYTVGV